MHESTARRTSGFESFSRSSIYAINKISHIKKVFLAGIIITKNYKKCSTHHVIKCLCIQTFNSRAIWVIGVLKAGHCQCCLYPDIGVFVCDSDQHSLMYPIAQIIVYLCIFTQTAQQLIHQLTHTKPYRMTVRTMRLRQRKTASW